MSTPSTPSAYSLRRSLTEAAAAKAAGTHVDARDLGARVSGHAPFVAEATGASTVLPYVVVTEALRWAMGWAPRNDAELDIHDALRFEHAVADEAAVAAVADAEGPYAVFEGERTAIAMNAQDDFLAQLIQAGHVERVDDDRDDWDVDDGPANDPEALEAEYAAEDAVHQAAATARAAGVTAPSPGYPYSVHNPFTGRQTWFVSGADARAYARAASAADALDGDLGVWSADGPGVSEYDLFRGGRPHAEG